MRRTKRLLPLGALLQAACGVAQEEKNLHLNLPDRYVIVTEYVHDIDLDGPRAASGIFATARIFRHGPGGVDTAPGISSDYLRSACFVRFVYEDDDPSLVKRNSSLMSASIICMENDRFAEVHGPERGPSSSFPPHMVSIFRSRNRPDGCCLDLDEVSRRDAKRTLFCRLCTDLIQHLVHLHAPPEEENVVGGE